MRTREPACIHSRSISSPSLPSLPHPFHLAATLPTPFPPSRRPRERKASVAVVGARASFLPLPSRVALPRISRERPRRDSGIIFASKDQPRLSLLPPPFRGKRVIPERVRASSPCYKRRRILQRTRELRFCAAFLQRARARDCRKKKSKITPPHAKQSKSDRGF